MQSLKLGWCGVTDSRIMKDYYLDTSYSWIKALDCISRETCDVQFSTEKNEFNCTENSDKI
jgi:hypothetical protein